jgi:hypothetical protein
MSDLSAPSVSLAQSVTPAPVGVQAVPPRAVMLCWLSAGVPGAVGIYSEGGVTVDDASRGEDRKVSPVYGGGISTAVGYGCYMASQKRSGFELGMCAPYVSYGRNHPVLGDRLSVFIPLVGSLQCTSTGSVGVSFSVPLFNPFFRLGFTCYLRNERAAPALTSLLTFAGRCVEGASRVGRATAGNARRVWDAVRIAE